MRDGASESANANVCLIIRLWKPETRNIVFVCVFLFAESVSGTWD